MKSAYERLEIETWPRRHHYRFFRDYDNPFFSVCVELDVTRAYEESRGGDLPSFFSTTLHASLVAANDTEPFRYRLDDRGVRIYETVGCGTTVLRSDETFSFGYFEFDRDPERFARAVRHELDEVAQSSGPLDDRPDRDDMIHYSILPWIPFTSFSHARRWGTDDSVPKIVFGQRSRRGEGCSMPVSVEVHHALVDGIHVARFLDRFQACLRDDDHDG